jgi:hypothetical protein
MRRLVPLVLCLLAASPAWADARAQLHPAFVKFLAQPSFEARTHADVGGRAIDSTVEFVAPDRYRTAGATPADCLVWVGVADGLPLQLRSTSTGKATVVSTVSYSRYGDPTIHIAAP